MPRPLDVPHQAILQLRNPTKEVIRFTDEELEKNVRTKVNEVVDVENGLDYYLTDKDADEFFIGRVEILVNPPVLAETIGSVNCQDLLILNPADHTGKFIAIYGGGC